MTKPDQARLLCAFDGNDESLPRTRDQWMEKLNQIYCQSISLECEFIEVSDESNLIEERNEPD